LLRQNPLALFTAGKCALRLITSGSFSRIVNVHGKASLPQAIEAASYPSCWSSQSQSLLTFPIINEPKLGEE